MPFVEIQPAKPPKPGDTGVRVGLSVSRGLSISLADDALAKLDGAEHVRVLLDLDPVCPRMRIVADSVGPFNVTRAPLGDRWRLVRIGHRPEIPAHNSLSGLACIWEALDGGKPGIEIDLPREFRTVEQRLTSTTNGLGEKKATAVSLPAVKSAARS